MREFSFGLQSSNYINISKFKKMNSYLKPILLYLYIMQSSMGNVSELNQLINMKYRQIYIGNIWNVILL